MSRPTLSFRPTVRPTVSTVPSQNFPPGALVPGQRPDRALNSAQFAAARAAREISKSELEVAGYRIITQRSLSTLAATDSQVT